MQADSPLVTYVYEASTYGGGHNPNIVCIHDVEAPLDNGFARSLIGPNWFGGPAPTSTHYLVGPDDICQGVPESRVAWHCGTGNPRSIAIEQCGYARYSLAEWNSPKGRVQQENVARLLADINRRRPSVRLRWLSNSELRAAWNNPGSPGGIVTHDQMRSTLGGTTHYDPMNEPGAAVSYPLQQVIDRAIQISNGIPEKEWDEMASRQEVVGAVIEGVANGNVLAAIGKSVLTTDTGTKTGTGEPQSLAALLAAIMGQLQQINQRLAQLEQTPKG